MAGCCSVFQRWLSLFLYMVGLIISGYSYYVHMAKKADENYVALCDIDETISCSKVFTSKYGKGSNLKYFNYILILRRPQKQYFVCMTKSSRLFEFCYLNNKRQINWLHILLNFSYKYMPQIFKFPFGFHYLSLRIIKYIVCK